MTLYVRGLQRTQILKFSYHRKKKNILLHFSNSRILFLIYTKQSI